MGGTGMGRDGRQQGPEVATPAASLKPAQAFSLEPLRAAINEIPALAAVFLTADGRFKKTDVPTRIAALGNKEISISQACINSPENAGQYFAIHFVATPEVFAQIKAALPAFWKQSDPKPYSAPEQAVQNKDGLVTIHLPNHVVHANAPHNRRTELLALLSRCAETGALSVTAPASI